MDTLVLDKIHRLGNRSFGVQFRVGHQALDRFPEHAHLVYVRYRHFESPPHKDAVFRTTLRQIDQQPDFQCGLIDRLRRLRRLGRYRILTAARQQEGNHQDDRQPGPPEEDRSSHSTHLHASRASQRIPPGMSMSGKGCRIRDNVDILRTVYAVIPFLIYRAFNNLGGIGHRLNCLAASPAAEYIQTHARPYRRFPETG